MKKDMVPGCLVERIPQGEHGTAKVIHDEPGFMDRLRGARDGMPLNEKKYTRLLINNCLWMTDAEFECATNAPIVRQMFGDILIAGLGLGLILGPLLKSKKVSSITVIEINPDVVKLIGPHYKSIKIVEGDARKWTPPHKAFDCIYFDIFQNVPNEDDAEDIKNLKARYRKALRRGGWTKAWCEGRMSRG